MNLIIIFYFFCKIKIPLDKNDNTKNLNLDNNVYIGENVFETSGEYPNRLLPHNTTAPKTFSSKNYSPKDIFPKYYFYLKGLSVYKKYYYLNYRQIKYL